MIDGKVFIRYIRENSQRHLEESRADKESSRLNTANRLHLIMVKCKEVQGRQGKLRQRRPRERTKRGGKSGENKRVLEKRVIGWVIWEWEAGEGKTMSWYSLGLGGVGPCDTGGSLKSACTLVS